MSRIVKNLGLLLSGKLAAGAISLVYIALSTRILGLTDYGVLNLVYGYATFMGALIAFSGFHPVVTFGTEALQSGDLQRLGRLLTFMTLLELGLAAVAIGLTALLAPQVGAALQWSAAAIELAPFYSLAILATVRATPWGLLQILNRFDLIAGDHAVMPIVRLAGTTIIWFTGGGLEEFLVVWALAAVLEGITMWALAWYVCRRPGIKFAPASLVELTQVWRENPFLLRFLTITNIDQTLREFAPKAVPLIIGWVAGPAATGLYSVAMRIGAVLTQLPQLLGQAAYSVIQQQISAGHLDKARRAVSKAAFVVTTVALAVALLISLWSSNVLTLVAGSEFAIGSKLLVFVLAARAVAAAAPLWSTSLTSIGRPGVSLWINIFCNLLILPVLPVLLWQMDVNGAGVHAVGQALLFAFLLWLANRHSYRSSARKVAYGTDD
ncbi:MAG: MATE family efflux transporter [Erythrobacteraceae bacterium]|jgi:O-antigen/teichoic acid export membrane protein|nr:MATE family efflux transporter [Erythrobacteraceae bacterium]